jgi:hypothetical protein
VINKHSGSPDHNIPLQDQQTIYGPQMPRDGAIIFADLIGKFDMSRARV